MRRHDTYSRPFRRTGQAKSNPLRFVGTMNRNHVTVSELVLARCAERQPVRLRGRRLAGIVPRHNEPSAHCTVFR
jgi:hypothetical protein